MTATQTQPQETATATIGKAPPLDPVQVARIARATAGLAAILADIMSE